MARIELIASPEGLSGQGRTVAERIVETRGEITRPFQVLLHAPAIAGRVAELGHHVRAGSGLEDADRELATLATGLALGCDFVWASHLRSAESAGVSDRTIAALQEGAELGEREATLVVFVDELCAYGTVSATTYAAAHGLLGTRGLVEFVTTIGYYTMLARVMGAFEAC